MYIYIYTDRMVDNTHINSRSRIASIYRSCCTKIPASIKYHGFSRAFKAFLGMNASQSLMNETCRLCHGLCQGDLPRLQYQGAYVYGTFELHRDIGLRALKSFFATSGLMPSPSDIALWRGIWSSSTELWRNHLLYNIQDIIDVCICCRLM